jgi:hypothetical protein
MKTAILLGVVGLLASVGAATGQEAPVAGVSPTSLKPPTPHKVIDLKRGAFVIDQPGNYVLTRSWTLHATADIAPVIIDVVADHVELDFRGFEIEVTGVDAPPAVTVISVQGRSFKLSNATIDICCEGGQAVHSTGQATVIDGLRGVSFERMRFEGEGATIRNAAFDTRFGVFVGPKSVIERTSIRCFRGCLFIDGDESRLLNSHVSLSNTEGIIIDGDASVLAGNFITWSGDGPGVDTGIEVRGDNNVLRDNTVAASGLTNTVFLVLGTGNVLDGNIADLVGDGDEPIVEPTIGAGIGFARDGNFYGDNRMEATIPFGLGAHVQTDWGGNVGY